MEVKIMHNGMMYDFIDKNTCGASSFMQFAVQISVLSEMC